MRSLGGASRPPAHGQARVVLAAWDVMSVDRAYAAEVAAALVNGRLGLFVGAGISARLGYPGWWSLVAELYEVTGGLEARRAFESGSGDLLLQVDRLLESQAPRISEVLRQRFTVDDERRARIAADPVYHFIASAGFPIYVTTNYDRSIEVAFKVHNPGVRPRTVDWSDGAAVTAALQRPGDPSAPVILHLHGVADRPEHIVLAERAYRRRYFADRSERARLDLALARDWLFLGFSFTDADFRAAMRERTAVFEETVPRHFAIFPEIGELARRDAYSAEMLGRFCVRPGYFPTRVGADGSVDFGALAELVAAITTEEQRARSSVTRARPTGVTRSAGPVSSKAAASQDDPNKGRFGGLAERAGYVLSAKRAGPARAGRSTETVVLGVEGPEASRVRFHLHPTFARTVVECPWKQGATLRIVAWGAFTVGAEVLAANGDPIVSLELDLAAEEQFDEQWRKR